MVYLYIYNYIYTIPSPVHIHPAETMVDVGNQDDETRFCNDYIALRCHWNDGECKG